MLFPRFSRENWKKKKERETNCDIKIGSYQ